MDFLKESWHEEPLSVFVFGASGDLAKKKTYPALFDLYVAGALPKSTIICGYARSKITDKEFRTRIDPFFKNNRKYLPEFLNLCVYKQGQYISPGNFKKASTDISNLQGNPSVENKIFYLALPPESFVNAASTVKQGGLTSTGFNRIVVEKPFGHDTASATVMAENLGKIFPEENLYRIDHYLGKEMVQALLTLRFSNAWMEPLLNNQFVQAVIVTFKEDIGTEGRGGYFDTSGIIRDIMQNHLMQVLSIVAMEPPQNIIGEGASDLIRDEKVKVLKCIKPWKGEDTVLGQYDGYLEDETVPDESKTPTFACTVMKVNNRRWAGVPFVMKAGKALDERKCEIRVQLKAPAGVAEMFRLSDDNSVTPLNEIVIRIQPREAVYIKSNVKSPGLNANVDQTYIDLTYDERYPEAKIPDAYTRLMLDVLRGQQQNFVRQDELIQGWKIVTPLLKDIEAGKLDPVKYAFGSRGPVEADELIDKVGGYVRHSN